MCRVWCHTLISPIVYFFRHPLWTVKHQLTTHRSEHRETTSQLPANRYKNKKITYLFNELFLKANEYRNLYMYCHKYKTKKEMKNLWTSTFNTIFKTWNNSIWSVALKSMQQQKFTSLLYYTCRIEMHLQSHGQSCPLPLLQGPCIRWCHRKSKPYSSGEHISQNNKSKTHSWIFIKVFSEEFFFK